MLVTVEQQLMMDDSSEKKVWVFSMLSSRCSQLYYNMYIMDISFSGHWPSSFHSHHRCRFTNNTSGGVINRQKYEKCILYYSELPHFSQCIIQHTSLSKIKLKLAKKSRYNSIAVMGGRRIHHFAHCCGSFLTNRSA